MSTKQIVAQTLPEPEIEGRIALHSGPARQARDAALAFRVVDKESAERGAAMVKICHQMHVTIETERKSITAPLRLTEQRVNGLFKPATKFLEEAVEHIKNEIGAYIQRTNEAREADAVAGRSVALAPPDVEGVSTRDVWTFTIEDPDLVPRSFCTPDPAKIREHMANGGVFGIPGVRFFQVQQVRTARK